jgi:hypothetical protein
MVVTYSPTIHSIKTEDYIQSIAFCSCCMKKKCAFISKFSLPYCVPLLPFFLCCNNLRLCLLRTFLKSYSVGLNTLFSSSLFIILSTELHCLITCFSLDRPIAHFLRTLELMPSIDSAISFFIKCMRTCGTCNMRYLFF